MRFILSAWLFLPLIAYGQYGDEPIQPRCSSNDGKPAWDLQNIIFTTKEEHWPDHSNATSEISFSLSPNNRPYVASCNATQTWTPPDRIEGVWYPCDMPDTALDTDLAWFTFNDDMGKIQINQTYTCLQYSEDVENDRSTQ
jgi:hypothetical protein